MQLYRVYGNPWKLGKSNAVKTNSYFRHDSKIGACHFVIFEHKPINNHNNENSSRALSWYIIHRSILKSNQTMLLPCFTVIPQRGVSVYCPELLLKNPYIRLKYPLKTDLFSVFCTRKVGSNSFSVLKKTPLKKRRIIHEKSLEWLLEISPHILLHTCQSANRASWGMNTTALNITVCLFFLCIPVMCRLRWRRWSGRHPVMRVPNNIFGRFRIAAWRRRKVVDVKHVRIFCGLDKALLRNAGRPLAFCQCVCYTHGIDFRVVPLPLLLLTRPPRFLSFCLLSLFLSLPIPFRLSALVLGFSGLTDSGSISSRFVAKWKYCYLKLNTH